jgi:Heterokaryon incompatibility protein (HET)
LGFSKANKSERTWPDLDIWNAAFDLVAQANPTIPPTVFETPSLPSHGRVEQRNNEAIERSTSCLSFSPVESMLKRLDCTESNTSVRSYTYDHFQGPLEVRVITILLGTSDQTLSLTIRHVPLQQIPRYEALSYVWTRQTPSHTIRCNSGTLDIGKHLKDALISLRSADTPRGLWVNRIAINQNDLNERAQQVKLMTEIYSSASVVLVWLGVSDAYTEQAFGLVKDLAFRMLEEPLSSDPGSISQKHSIDYPPSDNVIWEAL